MAFIAYATLVMINLINNLYIRSSRSFYLNIIFM